MSFFITLPDGTVAGMFGGIGSNSLRSAFLRRYGLSFDCRRQFKESIDKLRNEKVDLVLGNHPDQSGTLEKMIRILGGDTNVTDSDEWHAFLENVERGYKKLLDTDPE